MSENSKHEVTRRHFLQWVGIGTGGTLLGMGVSCRLLQPAPGEENPLSRSVARDWEKVYHDQYKYDRWFDWVCSPNDTHA
ncbi:MAG: hypothetical protein HY647_06170, partial [Acidobacteria bacterium]|nr:hypothetical protein [Acidobacteriota bacterium]